MPRLTCLGWPVRPICTGWSVQAFCSEIVSKLSCQGCLAPVGLSQLTYPCSSVLSSFYWLYNPDCPVLCILSCLYYPDRAVQLPYPNCSFLDVLSQMSSPGCPVLSWMCYPGCVILDVPSWLSVLPVFFWLSCPGIPFLAVLSWLLRSGCNSFDVPVFEITVA
jgi:hypothetical protein